MIFIQSDLNPFQMWIPRVCAMEAASCQGSSTLLTCSLQFSTFTVRRIAGNYRTKISFFLIICRHTHVHPFQMRMSASCAMDTASCQGSSKLLTCSLQFSILTLWAVPARNSAFRLKNHVFSHDLQIEWSLSFRNVNSCTGDSFFRSFLESTESEHFCSLQ